MPFTSRKSDIPFTLRPENRAAVGELETEDFTLRQAVRILRKRKQVVFGVCLVCGFLSLLISLVLRPYYGSIATIQISSEKSNPMSGALGALAGSLGGEDDLKIELQTNASILQSDALGLEVMDHVHFEEHHNQGLHLFGLKHERRPGERGLPLDAAPYAREKLLKAFESHLTITPLQNTRLIQVAFEDPDPKFAANVANVLVELFVKDRIKRRNFSTIEASDWMSGEITSLNKEVQAAQERLNAYQKKSGLIAMPTGGSSQAALSGGISSNGNPPVRSPILDRLMQLNQNLVQAETARISREAIYRVAQAGDIDALSNMAAEMNLGGNTDSSQSDLFAGLQVLRGQQTSLKLDLSTALHTYGAKNPHLTDTDQRLQAIDREIKAEVGRIRDRAKLDYDIARKNESEIRRAYDALEHEANNTNDAMMKLAILQQEADSSRFIYQDLYTKLQESKLSEGTQSSNVSVINPALSSATPLHPKKILNTAIGFIVGLILGMVIAFIIESFDDAIVTTVEVEQLTGVPVLGMIANFFNAPTVRESNKRPAGAGPPSSDARPDQRAWEAYLTLRTNLLLSQAGSPPRTLLVTSSLSGEGKTTTTYNLAMAFAVMGKRVLAIDADLRKPSLHKYSHLSNKKGLSNLVTSSMNPSEAIQQSHINENLFLLTSGPLPPNPTELLGSVSFSGLLESFLQQFDFVLIDSPPTMLVADALIISPKVDAVIVIVRSGKTTRPVLLRVTESLQRHAGNFVGFVLNAVDSTSPEHYYTYGYYGESYGKGYYDTDTSDTSKL